MSTRSDHTRALQTLTRLAGCLLFVVLTAAACSSPADTASAGIEATATAAPTVPPVIVPTTAPVPSATPAPSATEVPELPKPTATPFVAPEPDDQAFCLFMASEYFWTGGREPHDKFGELMPDNVPTSVMRAFHAEEVLLEPGLGDPRVNSNATMILLTAFASDLGRYLERECPGIDWVDIAVSHSGDPDFDAIPSAGLPASELDLCAAMTVLEAELEVERGRRGAIRTETATAAQAFADAIDPAAPFDVLALSHLRVTQAALSWNEVTFDLYLRNYFDEPERIDTEIVGDYFDTVCPEVNDTRTWLLPTGAAGALARPQEGEGLPDGWQVVPPEDILQPFVGDFRTLPVREATPLPSWGGFEFQGIEFVNLTVSWATLSTDPPQGALGLDWLYSGGELPFTVGQFGIASPDGTVYRADLEQSQIEPEILSLYIVFDVIPENLEGWSFNIYPD